MSAADAKQTGITAEQTCWSAFKDLKKYFPITRGIVIQRQVGDVKAVDGISFDIIQGETLGLVGESGCGKSTTGRTILQLYRPTAGDVYFEDDDLAEMKGETLRRMRRKMQMIFQDPYASLNPRMTVGNIVGEPLEVHNVATRQGAPGAGAGAAGTGGAEPLLCQPLPARVLGRPAAAHRRRPRPGPATRLSSSATSRSRRWTCRSRPRWSTCWRTCRRSSG